MRSIEARFLKVKEKNQSLGDYPIFAKAIRGQRFSKDIISRHFNKLVPKSDYDVKDKKTLITQLVKISNTG